jgi:hypothetical protein
MKTILYFFLLFALLFSLGGCEHYCPSYSSYNYNRKIVMEKSYKKSDARARAKQKKYQSR